MTLQQLKNMIEIVHCGSINEASKRLFIAQSSLSKSIKELEGDLGIALFERTNRGVQLSDEGAEFLVYARQVVEQSDLLEQRYKKVQPTRRVFSVSSQRYPFTVQAFAHLMKDFSGREYSFTLRESKTQEIIDDVKKLRSEIGVLYLDEYNEKAMVKLFKENDLVFTPLFAAQPFIFLSKKSLFAKKGSVCIEELKAVPYITFEYGEMNSASKAHMAGGKDCFTKNILVSDRATMFELLTGLNGYTISIGQGVSDELLEENNIAVLPLKEGGAVRLGYIHHKNATLSMLAQQYVAKLLQFTSETENFALPNCQV